MIEGTSSTPNKININQHQINPPDRLIVESYQTQTIKQNPNDWTPVLILQAKQIQGRLLNRNLIALCDTGSTSTMINKSSFPYGVEPSIGQPKRTTTTNGTYTVSETVDIEGIQFPEFGRRRIPDIKADVFDSPRNFSTLACKSPCKKNGVFSLIFYGTVKYAYVRP